MRYIFALAMIAGLGASGVALADNDGRGRATGAQERAMSAADMTAKFDELGYDIRRLTSDDAHYKAYMVDRESGGAVKVKLDKASGELIGAKLAQDDREARDRKATREHRETREHESARDHDDMDEHRESRERERKHREGDD